MSDATASPVVVLYEHALLGEGIAAYLTREGVDVTAVSVTDRAAVADAVGASTRVLVLEQSEPTGAVPLPRMSPDAAIVDVSHTIVAGDAPAICMAGLESILGVVRAQHAAGTTN
jgi:hypothetical protein